MKIDVSTLEGDELDSQVAIALGGELDGDGWRFDPPLTLYGEETRFIKTKRSFCGDWSYGGPIIEREGITVERIERSDGTYAYRCPHYSLHKYAPTYLVAAMRAFVALQGSSRK